MLVGPDDLAVHHAIARVGDLGCVFPVGGVTNRRATGLQLAGGLHVHLEARRGDELLTSLDAGNDSFVFQIRRDDNVGLIDRVAAQVRDNPADADGHLLRVAHISTEQIDGLHGNHRGETGI